MFEVPKTCGGVGECHCGLGFRHIAGLEIPGLGGEFHIGDLVRLAAAAGAVRRVGVLLVSRESCECRRGMACHGPAGAARRCGGGLLVPPLPGPVVEFEPGVGLCVIGEVPVRGCQVHGGEVFAGELGAAAAVAVGLPGVSRTRGEAGEVMAGAADRPRADAGVGRGLLVPPVAGMAGEGERCGRVRHVARAQSNRLLRLYTLCTEEREQWQEQLCAAGAE